MAFGPDELRNYVFLRSLMDAFEQRVLDYCSSHKKPEGRFKRIIEIRDALAGKGNLPIEVKMKQKCVPPCDNNEHCEGGNCVQRRVISGWPKDDPPRWDT